MKNRTASTLDAERTKLAEQEKGDASISNERHKSAMVHRIDMYSADEITQPKTDDVSISICSLDKTTLSEVF